MRNFFNTVLFTYINKVKGKFFIVSTVIFLVLIIAMMNINTIMDIFKSNTTEPLGATIIISNQSETYIAEEAVFKEVFKNNELKFITDKGQAKSLLNESIENIMVTISNDREQIYNISILSKRHSDKVTINKLKEVTEQLARYSTIKELNIQEESQNKLLIEPKFQIESYESDSESKMFAAYIMVFSFMIIMNFYVQSVASSIVSEKSNRVIEVLLTSAKATELFFGKIVGTCLASITQVGLLLVSGIAAYKIFDFETLKVAGITLDFSVLGGGELIKIGIFFILGYLLYSIMAGALASFVSNNDDLNQAILPVTICFMASTMLAVIYMMDTSATWIETLAYIPFLSPMIMIVKIIMVGVGNIELVINLGIIIVTIIISALIGSNLYAKGTLNDNKKITLKTIFHLYAIKKQ